MMAVKRTTIMADEELLERLRAVARRERLSLAEVIRQGLEWRAAQVGRPLRFIAAGASADPPHDTARRAGDITYEPPPWRSS
jgi:hypothetical protein